MFQYRLSEIEELHLASSIAFCQYKTDSPVLQEVSGRVACLTINVTEDGKMGGAR